LQSLGAGGELGGPARPGVNFGGKTSNLGATPKITSWSLLRSWVLALKELKTRFQASCSFCHLFSFLCGFTAPGTKAAPFLLLMSMRWMSDFYCLHSFSFLFANQFHYTYHPIN
jgi:hypothetical protein